jgi:predicted DNA-binding transcriptional regulator YafY
MQPDELLYQEYQRFLEDLLWTAGVNDGGNDDKEPDQNIPLSPELARRCEQWQVYQRYCREAFTLEIEYQQGECVEVILLEPHEVIDRNACLFLLGLDRRTQKQRLLSADHVLSAKQLPTKNQRPASQTIVTFALYGRLAKSYRLYPQEKVIYQSKTELHIKTQVSDSTGLMSRLLKYGASCQVLSPETLREDMRQHISRLLATLQGPD